MLLLNMHERSEEKYIPSEKYRKPRKEECRPKDNGTMARLKKRRMRRPIPRN
jgi:hypothetical protein